MKYLLLVTLLLIAFPNWVKANTEFGFDFNLPNALAGISDGQNYISGTLTAAKKSSRYEMAMPFFYYEYTHNPEICCIVDIRRIDLQLRSYRNNLRQGGYFGLTLRHSSVSGNDYFETERPVSYSRFGLGIVLGYKREVFNRIFWGANVNIGSYLSDGDVLASGDNTAILIGPTDNGSDVFLNIEFLKLGVRF